MGTHLVSGTSMMLEWLADKGTAWHQSAGSTSLQILLRNLYLILQKVIYISNVQQPTNWRLSPSRSSPGPSAALIAALIANHVCKCQYRMTLQPMAACLTSGMLAGRRCYWPWGCRFPE
jgi:hypothetical protein